jgi:hypothetical protein
VSCLAALLASRVRRCRCPPPCFRRAVRALWRRTVPARGQAFPPHRAAHGPAAGRLWKSRACGAMQRRFVAAALAVSHHSTHARRVNAVGLRAQHRPRPSLGSPTKAGGATANTRAGIVHRPILSFHHPQLTAHRRMPWRVPRRAQAAPRGRPPRPWPGAWLSGSLPLSLSLSLLLLELAFAVEGCRCSTNSTKPPEHSHAHRQQ